jgi:hypothetical protein
VKVVELIMPVFLVGIGWLAGFASGVGWMTTRLHRHWRQMMESNAAFLHSLREPPDVAEPSLFDVPAEGGDGVKSPPGAGDK